MSIRVLYGKDGEEVMYDSVTMRAFGPVFHEISAEYGLEDFIGWIADNYLQDAGWFHETNRFQFDSAYIKWLNEMRKVKS